VEAEIRLGDQCAAQRNGPQALNHYLKALQLTPGSAQIHCRVAAGWWMQRDHRKAVEHFENALKIEPNCVEAHASLGELKMISGDVDSALKHARRASEISPDDPEITISLAFILEAARQEQAAMDLVEKLRAAGNRSPRLAMLLGRLAVRFKQERQAIDLIEQTLAAGRFRAAREPASLLFTAAGLYDRIGEYDIAFARAKAANESLGARHDPRQVESLVEDRIGYLTRQRVRSLPRASTDSQMPVFIVGMPRSGTTLVEQIFASHPRVHAGGELDWLVNLAASTAGKSEFRWRLLGTFSLDRVEELSAAYLNRLRSLNPGVDRITDKMPLNFLYLGLIAILFPNARIIHCRRDPLDTCLSCYMTDFVAGHEFTTNLSWLGHFYRQYERMMAHWREVLDLSVLDVDYERLVSDPQTQTRRMLDFAGLPWDPQCLLFHENGRFAATASHQQVRTALYASSVGRAKNYVNYLGPLRAGLGWA